jgi:hypothetical protein
METLNDTPNYLLTFVGNPKTDKAIKYGYWTAIMHLAPARLSGAEVCAHATDGCRAACLNTSGHGGIGLDENGLNSVQIARIRRTRYLRNHRAEFFDMLGKEIDAHIRRCKREGLTPSIRLNGTSDLKFERMKFKDCNNIMEYYDDLQFYDYTKYPMHLRNTAIENYHLTFSLAESNRANAIDAIRNGTNVAAVLRVPRNGILPATVSLGGSWRKVVDGDAHDLRFLDPASAVVGLRAKGRAIKDTSGFVLDV